ncbi:ribonuclease P protein component [Sphingobacterium bovistauri]|uniref:Ribonuclease P protein component n=1 Tax=Sphingobacterium bovistauri TaxID=2781959 RepID=A0ABS7Z601_9SPHI|nr:ribonuclease P protein component [Sphingobacterium bovistauri]MCA5005585.1 ribonuclease P protein component [Sphingobacterium bovistauri]
MKKTFTKEERLCSKRKIDSLFYSGSSFIVYPFRVVYLLDKTPEGPSPVQVIISVSKRRFRRAHDRNRIKRLMREVYRLQKNELLYEEVAKLSLNLSVAIQYVGKEELDFELLYGKMSKTLKQLANAISS